MGVRNGCKLVENTINFATERGKGVKKATKSVDVIIGSPLRRLRISVICAVAAERARAVYHICEILKGNLRF